jgi:hypothetical protein
VGEGGEGGRVVEEEDKATAPWEEEEGAVALWEEEGAAALWEEEGRWLHGRRRKGGGGIV